MNKKVLLAVVAAIATFGLSACSSAPKPAVKVESEATKEPAKAPEAVTAQRAFYEMYKSARAWATDLLALNVTSGEIPEIKNEGGKAGLWKATFVSPSLKQGRVFTYAVVNSGTDVRKGVSVGDALPWFGSTPASKAFSNSEFMVDSDAAYKTASEKAAGWLKTHPNQKVKFQLGDESRFAAPVWYVMWGTTKNGYAAFVNAATGVLVK
jgi:hypothetical protein